MKYKMQLCKGTGKWPKQTEDWNWKGLNSGENETRLGEIAFVWLTPGGISQPKLMDIKNLP